MAGQAKRPAIAGVRAPRRGGPGAPQPVVRDIAFGPSGRAADREHRVPLSRRALELLKEAKELSDGSGLVYPGVRPGRPLSENTHAKLLRELGFDAVTRGFRSSFRDYATQQTHTVMEAALALKLGEDRCGLARR